MNPDLSPTRRYEVDKVKVASRVATSKVMLMDAKFSEFPDMIRDQLVHTVEGFVLGGCKREIYWMIAYPATWWQAFKRDVLAPLTRSSITPIAKRWHDFLTSPRLERKEFTEIVYSNICPHGTITAPGDHITWLVAEPQRPFR